MELAAQIRSLLERNDAKPGCYDEGEFRALEERDPARALEAYARFVLARPRTSEEDERVRLLVDTFAAALREHGRGAEFRGQCLNMSLALLRILEAHGCWAFAMIGSVRVRFPKASKIRQAFLRVQDPANVKGQFEGHAWLVCPPFLLIDLTLHVQRWKGSEGKFIPRAIVVEDAQREEYQPGLWTPTDAAHLYKEPGRLLQDLWEWWPTRTVHFPSGASCTYQSHGVTVPSDQLDDNVMRIGERSVADFYRNSVLPAFTR